MKTLAEIQNEKNKTQDKLNALELLETNLHLTDDWDVPELESQFLKIKQM